MGRRTARRLSWVWRPGSAYEVFWFSSQQCGGFSFVYRPRPREGEAMGLGVIVGGYEADTD